MTTTTSKNQLYDCDFYAWTIATSEALHNKDWDNVDLANLIEEIEAMGRSEKTALSSNLIVVLMHLLKYQYQPQERSISWINSIVEHRRRINRALKDSPSLKPYIQEVFWECYQDARVDAAAETGLAKGVFPVEPPFSLVEAIDPDYQPWNEQAT